MDRYNRAWRDPRSPLTPLTPLTTRVFNFDNVASPSPTPTHRKPRNYKFEGLKSSLLEVPNGPPLAARRGSKGARHFSQDFMRIRAVFSPCAQSTKTENNSYSTPKARRQSGNQMEDETKHEHQVKREFKRSSPVDQPTLSPRVSSLLNRTGNEHLTELFTRQEIDLQVLIQMTLEDLESLGVRGVRELKLAIDVIKFAKKFF